MRRLFTKYQKVISISVALFLLFICSSFSSATQIEPIPGMIENENKIEKDLREAMDAAGDDEYIPVCLWRKVIDPVELNSLILERSGFDPEIYEDIEAFNELVVPEIEEEVRVMMSRDDDLIGSEIEPEQNEASLIKERTRKRINEYIHQKRQISREEYTRRNAEFLEKVLSKRDDRNIFFCSQYSPTIIVEAVKSEIAMLANDQTVESISLHEEVEFEPTMCDVLSQVGVYCEGGTGYDLPGYWSALTGLNTVIGVLEVSHTSGYGGKFDETAPQLNGNTRLHFIDNIRSSGTPVPYTVDNHATAVMSIIAGQSVFFNGKTYRGVVPNATVYQAPVVTYSDLATGIETCLQNDVSIINMSLGANTSTYYSSIEKQIDYYTTHDNVVCVIAAGNEGEDSGGIMSPGRALNAITVGNVMTKSSTNTVLSAPFNISSTSSYVEPNYCANKPDLVAPGCLSVLYNYSANLIGSGFGTGTSFSAPIVAGIIAQVYENDLIYMLNPLMAKTALLVGTNLSEINTSFDSPTTASFYDRCGAGMVNAINSIQYITPYNNIEYLGPLSESMPTYGSSKLCTTGSRIRGVLTFSKNNNYDITSTSNQDNINLLLVKRDSYLGDYVVSSSVSDVNNDEIIDVTIMSEGYYYFVMDVQNVSDYNNPPTVCVMYKQYS